MSYCPKCGANNEEGAEHRFCFACGAELSTESDGEPEQVGSDAITSSGGADARSSPRSDTPVSKTAALLGEGKPTRRLSKSLFSPPPTSFGTAETTVPGTGSRKSEVVAERPPTLEPPPPETDQSISPQSRKAIQRKGSKIKKRDSVTTPVRMQSQLAWFDQVELLETMAEVFHPESTSGWLLVGYQPDCSTLELQACSDGAVSGCLEFLDDKEQQYVMVRIPLEGSAPHLMASKSRDVLIVWQGSKIPIMQRGRFAEHIQLVKQVLQPVHAHLTAKNRENMTQQMILERSDPKSGSHEL